MAEDESILNADAQIESDISNDAQIDSLLSRDAQIESDLGNVVEVSHIYRGEETTDIIISVDNIDYRISGTIKPTWVDDSQSLPEVGSPNVIYGIKNDEKFAVWDSDNSEYVFFGYVLTETEKEKLVTLIEKLDNDEFGKVDGVTVDDSSVVNGNKIAQLYTINNNYNASSNKLATESDLPTNTSELANDGDGQSPFATESYVNLYGGKIDSISVNNTPQTIDANKNVNITVPTQASDVHALPDSTKYGAGLGVNGTTVQLKDQDGNDLGASITTQDTGATSVEVTGNGNAVTEASYSSAERKITLTKGTNFATSSELTSVDNRVTAIEGKIPSEATSSNQLADKQFVNSSIATATATFRGTYNLVVDLSLTTSATEQQIATALLTAISTADNNDYCFVQIPTSDATPTEIARIDRYKFNGTSWSFEYSLNNSGFTASQWAAINSGATTTNISQIGTNTSDISSLNTNKVNKTTTIAGVDLQDDITVAEMQTALSDASHRFVTDTEKTTWSGKQDVIPAYLKTASVSDKTLTITKQDDSTVTFQGGSDADNTTIVLNGSDELSAVGITDGTTPLLYADIYDAITTTWEV